MSEVKINTASEVTLHFSLKLVSGQLIDSNFDAAAATFTMGDGSLLSGFEQPLIGMQAGQKASYTIPAAAAFGEPNEDNIQCFKRRDLEPLAASLTPQVQAESNSHTSDPLVPGLVLSFADAANGELAGVIDRIELDDVYVNFNHPLAGKDIIFDVHIVNVKTAK